MKETFFFFFFFFFFLNLGRHITLEKKMLQDDWLMQIAHLHPSTLELIQCHGDQVTAAGLNYLFNECTDSLLVNSCYLITSILLKIGNLKKNFLNFIFFWLWKVIKILNIFYIFLSMIFCSFWLVFFFFFLPDKIFQPNLSLQTIPNWLSVESHNCNITITKYPSTMTFFLRKLFCLFVQFFTHVSIYCQSFTFWLQFGI